MVYRQITYYHVFNLLKKNTHPMHVLAQAFEVPENHSTKHMYTFTFSLC